MYKNKLIQQCNILAKPGSNREDNLFVDFHMDQ